MELASDGVPRRSKARAAERNGYRDWIWAPRAGAVEFCIPKLRKVSYFPGFLESRRMAEKTLITVVQEADVQGVYTRSVDDLVQAIRMSGHLQEPGKPALLTGSTTR